MSTDQSTASIRAEVRTVKGECDRRHERHGEEIRRVKDVQIEHDRLLSWQFGPGGKNGRVGNMETRLGKLEALPAKIFASALGGGGAVAGAIEVVRLFL